MDYESAIKYLESSTKFDAVIYFEIMLAREADLDRVSEAATAIGWRPEISRDHCSVRVFRPVKRTRDLN